LPAPSELITYQEGMVLFGYSGKLKPQKKPNIIKCSASFCLTLSAGVPAEPYSFITVTLQKGDLSQYNRVKGDYIFGNV
jgi:hypothetical protein